MTPLFPLLPLLPLRSIKGRSLRVLEMTGASGRRVYFTDGRFLYCYDPLLDRSTCRLRHQVEFACTDSTVRWTFLRALRRRPELRHAVRGGVAVFLSLRLVHRALRRARAAGLRVTVAGPHRYAVAARRPGF